MAKIGEAVETYLTGAQWQTFQVTSDGNPVVMYDCTGGTCPDFPGMEWPIVTYSVGFTASDINPEPWTDWTYYGSFVLPFVIGALCAWVGFKLGYRIIFPTNG